MTIEHFTIFVIKQWVKPEITTVASEVIDPAWSDQQGTILDFSQVLPSPWNPVSCLLRASVINTE